MTAKHGCTTSSFFPSPSPNKSTNLPGTWEASWDTRRFIWNPHVVRLKRVTHNWMFNKSYHIYIYTVYITGIIHKVDMSLESLRIGCSFCVVSTINFSAELPHDLPGLGLLGNVVCGKPNKEKPSQFHKKWVV